MSISFLVGKHRIRFAGKTDVGRVRDHNEDNLLLPTELPLAVVSDGMGGHACGEVASKIAVESVEEHYVRTNEESSPTWPLRLPQWQIERDRMTTAIKLANMKIWGTSQADADKRGMGCTIEALFFSQGRFYIGHVGDSRVYRIRAAQISQLTEDHSLFNDYRRMREMAGEDEANFPHKNVVVRALGMTEHVYVDVIVDDYQANDVYVVCTDGLSGMISDRQIQDVVGTTENLDNASNTLVKLANEAGGKDNITAVLARIEST